MKHHVTVDLMHSMYLSHHGIMGMHWGVKNGPPYPLDKKLSLRIQKGHNEKARHTQKELKDMRSGKTKTTKKDRVGKTHRSDPKEHRWIQGLNASDISRVANIGTLIADGDLSESALRTLDRPKRRVVDADVMAVNPGRFDPETENDRGYSNNCGLCSAALALRAMGYDVQASRATDGTLITGTEYYFDGALPYKERNPSNIQKRLESFGAEGLGVLSIRRANGCGHAVYFQNERQADGSYKPVIIDGQARTKYTSLEDFLRAENADVSQFTTITRLDRATPNWKHIGEDSAVISTHSKRGMQTVANPLEGGTLYDSDNIRFQHVSGSAGKTWGTKRPDTAERTSVTDGLASVRRENVNERVSKKASNLSLDRSLWGDSITNMLSTMSSTPVKSLSSESSSKSSTGASSLSELLNLYNRSANKKILTQRVVDLVDHQKERGWVSDSGGWREVGRDSDIDRGIMKDYYNQGVFRKSDGVWKRRVSASYGPENDLSSSLSKAVKDISTTKTSSVGNLGSIDDLVSKWKNTSIEEFVGNERHGDWAYSNGELMSMMIKRRRRSNWD